MPDTGASTQPVGPGALPDGASNMPAVTSHRAPPPEAPCVAGESARRLVHRQIEFDPTT